MPNNFWIISPLICTEVLVMLKRRLCESVRVQSEWLQTEPDFDFVFINGERFSGTTSIDRILPNVFDIQFTSDRSTTAAGFKLNWD